MRHRYCQRCGHTHTIDPTTIIAVWQVGTAPRHPKYGRHLLGG